MSLDAVRTISEIIAKPRLTLLHAGWIVLASTIGLAALGIDAIDLARPDGAGALASDAKRQLVFLAVGLVAAAIAVVPRTRTLEFLGFPLMAAVLIGLIVLIAPGVPPSIVSPRNGARCWINLGFTDIQPSELGKVAYVMVLASYLRRRSTYRTLLGLIPPGLLAAFPMALILLQPDLGTALLFVPTLVAMLVAAGARLAHLIGACGLGAAFLAAVVVSSLLLAQQGKYPLLKKYQVDRIAALMDRARGDERRLSDRGFQGEAALMVGGAGGLAGHGEERSRALVQFSGLPERHNDMIFAVVLNRHGFMGALLVIGLYISWVGGALLAASSTKDPWGRLTIVGLAAMVATQMTINIGMNIGLLPITGITLPFVSYGGSSLVSGLLMVGVIFNIAMRRPPHLWRESFEYDRINGS
ncbi:MAG: FtsW/RodA/SpoVE family cell cycle protein [Planctomycetota bacterium]|nr:FtsW/RodA/SpoVE family cell cycle protein [Planctomycetota bacterium]